MQNKVLQMTYSQLYTGFIGLSIGQIKSLHPLGDHLRFIGKQILEQGMHSECYTLNKDLYFLLIVEDSVVVAQRTYSQDVHTPFEALRKLSVENDYSGQGFYIEAPQGRLYIDMAQDGGAWCLIASIY